MKKKFELKIHGRLNKIVKQIERLYNCECWITIDSTEGIVRTSVGIKHDKEEQMCIYIPPVKGIKEFNISFSPISESNIKAMTQILIEQYLFACLDPSRKF